MPETDHLLYMNIVRPGKPLVRSKLSIIYRIKHAVKVSAKICPNKISEKVKSKKFSLS